MATSDVPARPEPRSLPLEGRRVVVAGLARSGVAAVRFLTSRGAEVVASDRREEADLGPAVDQARRCGAALDLGGHSTAVFAAADLIVVSPGVPMGLGVLQAARLRGVPVIAEVELAARFLRGKMAGITGSNGKSTTTALAGAMLQEEGLPARVCGNIGTPLVEMLEQDTEASVYAVELSSFQLEGIVALRPAASVVVNLSPDHLDRYRDYGAYVAAKARIFMSQREDDVAITNSGDPDSRLLASAIRCRRLSFSSKGAIEEGACLRGSEIVLAREGRVEPLMPVQEVPLAGTHNLENIMAAALAALHLGAGTEAIRRAVRAFRALPHRLERIGAIDGVEYFNDSKATNVASAMKALESFPGRKVFLILGGRDKGGDFRSLRPLLEDRVASALLIGEAASTIERQISGAAPVVMAGTLDRAVAEARAAARAGDVVVLAPACASFDQFRNYEERGERFRSLVRSLSDSAREGDAAGAPRRELT